MQQKTPRCIGHLGDFGIVQVAYPRIVQVAYPRIVQVAYPVTIR